ncbi:MAG: hypothetical protein NC094_04645 [Bacteroidales bacterium]|nr:hypothetical protein [Lachnoclostridium sp.]MCM1383979.1 hypothetical protein [Lachnoclostridium sp.]MCM1464688.1 hypothetical protein [Bacteroidales bacterium]
MVNSVLAVPKCSRLKREDRKSSHEFQKKKDNALFAQILEETQASHESASQDCTITTYGRDCRLQTFHYHTKEYLC